MSGDEKHCAAIKADKYISRDGGDPTKRYWQPPSQIERIRMCVEREQWNVLGYLDDPQTKTREQAQESFRAILKALGL